MIILADMDEVLADFEGHFLEQWRKAHPDKPYISLEERKIFGVDNQYPPELKEMVTAVYQAPGFYKNIPLVPGGLEAITEMDEKGHEVRICTAPLKHYKNCILEKYDWVNEKLGPKWVEKLIVSRDKTLILGDILIDDKPDVKGATTPTWEQVIYDFYYNHHVKDKKRITWQMNWQEVLGI